MLSRRRYRIHFGANFDHDVEVDGLDIDRIKAMAAELARNPTASMIGDAKNMQCAWITITPLGEPGDGHDPPQA